MPHTFIPPPIPSDQSVTLGRVREDNREHDRALQLELFRLTTYVNTLGGGGGGGSTITYGATSIDFDADLGLNESSVVVTGQTSILVTSKVEAFIMADDTTGDHTAADHRYVQGLGLSLTCGAIVAGVGFTIYARCPHKLHGFWAVRWRWSD